MKKAVAVIAIVLASLIGGMILLVCGYLIYVAAQYYRIEDCTPITIEGQAGDKISLGTEYSIITYNLGFGAYSPEYTFFMDEGEMLDGTKTVGKYGKGMSREDVEKNVKGQISIAREQAADFYFFQEIDTDSDRSYHINMLGDMSGALAGYSRAFAYNFHTANLLYPFGDPIGKSESGIGTYTKHAADSSTRRSFPVSSAFPDKFFDLDRCFSMTYLPIEGTQKQLVLLNLHMSAYDKGGTIRAQQLNMLREVLAEESEKGNYVIAGGDFNHCLIRDKFDSDEAALSYFESKQKTPEWVKNSLLRTSELAAGYTIKAPMNEPTCRGADVVYEKGTTYTTVIDGFIVSDNVTTTAEAQTIYPTFSYSDHNPVKLTFKLN